MGKRRGKGEGTIYRRKDGTWCGQITLGTDANGKQLRKSVYDKSYAIVVEELQELRRKYRAGELETQDMKFSTFLDFWWGSIKHHMDPLAYQDIVQVCRQHLIPFLGHLQTSKIAPWVVISYYRDLEASGRRSAVIHRSGKLLRRALDKAVKLGLLRVNPAREEKLPRHKTPEIHPLHPEQVQLFLEAAEQDRLYPLYVLAVDTGMRLGEILALSWTDVDLERGEVSVTKSLSEGVDYKLRIKDVKTKYSRRRIRITPRTVEVLREWKKQNPYSVVFVTRKGGYWRRGNLHTYSFKRILVAAGLPPIRFHDLRHTCATLLLSRNVHPKLVQERLGHSSIKITLDTYSHVLPTMQEGVVGVMAEFLPSRNGSLAVGDVGGGCKGDITPCPQLV